uniref:DGCR6 protein n=1 Tax=Malurus cyaneus samueli TaxID=2593467 RepID=A0A8C5TWM2_9PASS
REGAGGRQWRDPVGTRQLSSSGSRCYPGSRSGTTGCWPSCRRLSRHYPGERSPRGAGAAAGAGADPVFARSACQQRLSYTTLSELALALLDGTVFEIVQGLLEIQHLTEKNLYSQRRQLHSEHRGLKQELFHRHKEAQQCCRPHNLPLLRAAQQREMEAMEQQIREEQRMMDEKIVLELDQKVIDQQSTLEKAGVSGFYITTNPQELTLQMNLLELIRKLQQKEAEAEKAFP